MELSREQFGRIKDCLPRQRGNVRIGNFVLLNALLYVLEHGCKRRGGWHTKAHLVSTTCSVRSEVGALPGRAGDAPKRRERLRADGPAPFPGCPLCMDRA